MKEGGGAFIYYVVYTNIIDIHTWKSQLSFQTLRNVFQQFFIRIQTKLSTSLIKTTLVFSSLHTHPKFILQISVCKKYQNA